MELRARTAHRDHRHAVGGDVGPGPHAVRTAGRPRRRLVVRVELDARCRRGGWVSSLAAHPGLGGDGEFRLREVEGRRGGGQPRVLLHPHWRVRDDQQHLSRDVGAHPRSRVGGQPRVVRVARRGPARRSGRVGIHVIAGNVRSLARCRDRAQAAAGGGRAMSQAPAHERSECATRAASALSATAPEMERARKGSVDEVPGVIFEEVSKFYGEVLGVNRVTLNIPPGITSLVGPNGAGKTTLMNLMTGLIFPDHGSILMRGISPRDPEALMRVTGYATQYDTAPRWATGFTFITTGLLLFGYGQSEAEEKAWKALERLSLTDAANRKVASYSKGMRQRVRLAQAIAHDPELLVLDEPLNGLDPLVRAETIALFRVWASEGKHVILSSHVLQEVDLISDQVVLIANGMIVAEGTIRTVRDEIQEHPSQYLVRCRDASGVASRLFSEDHVTEIRLSDDRLGLLVMTRDREQFARALGRIAVDGHRIESVVPADENVDALYEYLIGGES